MTLRPTAPIQMNDRPHFSASQTTAESVTQYFLKCRHPDIKDTDDDPDETYLEIVFREEVHEIFAENDAKALEWVAAHEKGTVELRGRKESPKPICLTKVVKEWR